MGHYIPIIVIVVRVTTQQTSFTRVDRQNEPEWTSASKRKNSPEFGPNLEICSNPWHSALQENSHASLSSRETVSIQSLRMGCSVFSRFVLYPFASSCSGFPHRCGCQAAADQIKNYERGELIVAKLSVEGPSGESRDGGGRQPTSPRATIPAPDG